MNETTTDDIDDVDEEDLDDVEDDDDEDDDDDEVDPDDDNDNDNDGAVDAAGAEPVALYDRDAIESADDTGLIASEELTANALILQGINGKT
jgi:hypothetical protein